MPDVASVAKHIQELTRKGVAFPELKSLTQAETLGYFRVDCRTRIVADASPVRLGTVLAQEQRGTWRAVSYASRSLTEVEKRRKRRWHLFGPLSDSTCICPEEALCWKRITNPWNESIHVLQNLVRELREGVAVTRVQL